MKFRKIVTTLVLASLLLGGCTGWEDGRTGSTLFGGRGGISGPDFPD